MKPAPKSAKQPTCVIELRPPSPGYEGFSRERIKEFEKLCQTNETMKRAFVRIEGRKFYFAFDTKTDTYEFLSDTAAMFEKRGVGWQRTTYPVMK